jgi:hypothetical protein
MIPTSIHAEVRYNGTRIRSFLPGIRDSSGSASLFYDPDDAVVSAIINDTYVDGTALSSIQMIFDTALGKSVAADIVITNISMSASFGVAQVCDIQFRVSDKPTQNL